MVDVTHDGDDRRTGLEIFLAVHLLLALDFLGNLRGDELDFVTEFLGHEHESLGIEPLVDGHHQSQAHTSADNLHHRGVVHKGREVVHGHEFGNLQDLILGCLSLELFLSPGGCGLPLLLTIFCSEVVLLAFVHPRVGLLDLLLDLLLHLLLLCLGHGRTETLTAVALAPAALVRVVLAAVGAVVSRILACLGDVHLLLRDALALLRGLLVELAEVDLTHHLQARACRSGGLGSLFGLCLRLRFGFRSGFRLHDGLRLLNHGFGLGLFDRLRFHHGFRFGFRFGLGLHDGFGLCDRFRLGFRFGSLLLVVDEGVGLDADDLFDLLFFRFRLGFLA